MLLKVWALTLILQANTSGGVALTTQKYIYTTVAECEVWRKFWEHRQFVYMAQCTNDYVVVPK